MSEMGFAVALLIISVICIAIEVRRPFRKFR
jgi:hypothetical protein